MEAKKKKEKLYEKLHMDRFNFWTSMTFLIIILSLVFIIYPFATPL